MKAERQGVCPGSEDESPVIVCVGFSVGVAHHRSVAFAGHLSQMHWPDDWKVEAEHRDLTAKVEKMKARKRRKS
jgi:RNase adaptor protein for sRNA GlmZ degradation